MIAFLGCIYGALAVSIDAIPKPVQLRDKFPMLSSEVTLYDFTYMDAYTDTDINKATGEKYGPIKW